MSVYIFDNLFLPFFGFCFVTVWFIRKIFKNQFKCNIANKIVLTIIILALVPLNYIVYFFITFNLTTMMPITQGIILFPLLGAYISYAVIYNKKINLAFYVYIAIFVVIMAAAVIDPSSYGIHFLHVSILGVMGALFYDIVDRQCKG